MMNIDELKGAAPVARYEIKSGSTIAEGGLVCLDSDGKAVPAADTSGLKCIGVAEAVREGQVAVGCGVVRIDNDSTNALARAHRGEPAYAAGAAKVASTSTNKVACGIVVDVDADGVWLDVRPAAIAAARAAAAAAAAAALASA